MMAFGSAIVTPVKIDSPSLQSPVVLKAALRAVHHILIQARLEALDWTHNRKSVDAQKMADYLDAVESLPEIISQDWDGGFDHFRQIISAIGKSCPELSGLIDNFDREIAGDPLFDALPARPNTRNGAATGE
jgi:hypothetical protein